jgi:hypothetical protein
VPGHEGACLTYGLHFPYRRLILCFQRASMSGGAQIALPLRRLRDRHR